MWPREPCHAILAQLLGWAVALDTHCGDCGIYLLVYQVEGFLGVWSAFWRQGRVGGRHMSQTFPRRSPLLTDPGLRWLPANWQFTLKFT